MSSDIPAYLEGAAAILAPLMAGLTWAVRLRGNRAKERNRAVEAARISAAAAAKAAREEVKAANDRLIANFESQIAQLHRDVAARDTIIAGLQAVDAHLQNIGVENHRPSPRPKTEDER